MKKNRDGDFTRREREIREALFDVFYKKRWVLARRSSAIKLDDKQDLKQWKFVDAVIDRLRQN